MRGLCLKLTRWRWFERSIIAVIVINALVLGLETYPYVMDRYGSMLLFFNKVVLFIFLIEAILKITAVAPKFGRYFGNGWNLFDFSIVVLSLIPQTGEFALIARTVRLLRVFRLITLCPNCG